MKIQTPSSSFIKTANFSRDSFIQSNSRSTLMIGVNQNTPRLDKQLVATCRDSKGIKEALNHQEANIQDRNANTSFLNQQRNRDTANGSQPTINGRKNPDFEHPSLRSNDVFYGKTQRNGNAHQAAELKNGQKMFQNTLVSTNYYQERQVAGLLTSRNNNNNLKNKSSIMFGEDLDSSMNQSFQKIDLGIKSSLLKNASKGVKSIFNPDAEEMENRQYGKKQNLFNLKKESIAEILQIEDSQQMETISQSQLSPNQIKKKKNNLYKMFEKMKNSSQIHDIIKGEVTPDRSRSRSVSKHKNTSTFNIISGQGEQLDKAQQSKKIFRVEGRTDPIIQAQSCQVSDDEGNYNPKSTGQPSLFKASPNKEARAIKKNIESKAFYEEGGKSPLPPQKGKKKVFIDDLNISMFENDDHLHSESDLVVTEITKPKKQTNYQDEKKETFERKAYILEQNKIQAAQKLQEAIYQNDTRLNLKIDQELNSFVDLLKEDATKKNFELKKKQREDGQTKTLSLYLNPQQNREQEKYKLSNDMNADSFADNFKGDPKLRSYKEQDLLKSETISQHSAMYTRENDGKVLLQNQEAKPLIEEDDTYMIQKQQRLVSMTNQLKQQIAKKQELIEKDKQQIRQIENQIVEQAQKEVKEEIDRNNMRKQAIMIDLGQEVQIAEKQRSKKVIDDKIQKMHEKDENRKIMSKQGEGYGIQSIIAKGQTNSNQKIQPQLKNGTILRDEGVKKHNFRPDTEQSKTPRMNPFQAKRGSVAVTNVSFNDSKVVQRKTQVIKKGNNVDLQEQPIKKHKLL